MGDLPGEEEEEEGEGKGRGVSLDAFFELALLQGERDSRVEK